MLKSILKYYMKNGSLFKVFLKELEGTEKYSPVEVECYQNEKLQQTIRIVCENVSYYRNVMKKLKLTPEDIKIKEDLRKLPIINKQIVQQNFKDFRNANFKGLVFKGYTSGTTGSPGMFLRDLKSINFENAFLWR